MLEGLQRRARDEEGNSILVPQDMNYSEWKEKYVTNNNDVLKNSKNNGNISKNVNKEEKNLQYLDITNNFINTKNKEYKLNRQQYYVDDNGIKYNVDDKHIIMRPSKNEVEVAKLLGQTFGGQVNIIPRISYPQNIKTPDYMINNTKYDLKTLTENKKNTIYNAVHKQKKQSNNFIIDISENKMTEDEAIKQIKGIY